MDAFHICRNVLAGGMIVLLTVWLSLTSNLFAEMGPAIIAQNSSSPPESQTSQHKPWRYPPPNQTIQVPGGDEGPIRRQPVAPVDVDKIQLCNDMRSSRIAELLL